MSKQDLIVALNWEIFIEHWGLLNTALDYERTLSEIKADYANFKRRYYHAGRPRGYSPKPKPGGTNG